MSNDQLVRVCPSCGSPYLVSQIITETEVNSNLQWEITYIAPDELTEAMETPTNQVTCSRCEWEGNYDHLVHMPINDAEVLHERTPVEYTPPSTLNDVVATVDTPMVFKLGQVVNILDEPYVIISMSTVNCATSRFNADTYTYTEQSSGPLELFILTPCAQDVEPSGRFLTFTRNKLTNILNGKLTL